MTQSNKEIQKNLNTCNEVLIENSKTKNDLISKNELCQKKIDQKVVEKNLCITSSQELRNTIKQLNDEVSIKTKKI